MLRIKIIFIIIMISFFSSKLNSSYEKLAFDFSFNDLDGSEIKLSEFKNKVLVVTNVASYCGFTSQYEDLQEIWEKYQDRGLVVIGVPSNSFNQEMDSNKENSLNPPKITANFENVDISDVFNSILLSSNLQAILENNIIFVGENILNKS